MNTRIQISRFQDRIRTQPLVALFLVAFALVAGCQHAAAPAALPFVPPDEFSESGVIWQRSEDGPTQSDNQQVGAFFERHPKLIGSPEWSGQPQKYVDKASAGRKRFYFYSGNAENPSWNAIEANGSRLIQLNGTGTPGDVVATSVSETSG